MHAAGAELYPSLGGWSLSDTFPEMAADENARMNFAEKCIELIEDYGFDGLDIDWEVCACVLLRDDTLLGCT